MTIIHDLDAPTVEPQALTAENTSNRSWVVAIFAASASILTAVNLFVSVHLYGVNSDVAVLESRLEQLSTFEKRLIDKMNLVNTGLQNQFDQLNNNFDSRFAAVSKNVGELKQKLAQVGTRNEFGTFGTVSAATEPGLLASDAPQAFMTEADVSMAIAEPRRSGVRELPSLSPSYQRFQTADGKVTYRKIR
jgi:hypothetical protein